MDHGTAGMTTTQYSVGSSLQPHYPQGGKASRYQMYSSIISSAVR